jgi:hypothetical protein
MVSIFFIFSPFRRRKFWEAKDLHPYNVQQSFLWLLLSVPHY